jgi:hypothetical protein
MAENRELALVLKLVADEFQKELKNSQGALSSFNNFIKDWRTQLAAAGTALFAVAKATANFGEEALKGAQKAGTTVETFTALSHAARMADVEQQTLINGMKTLSVAMVEAGRGNKEQSEMFARLGISVVDATGKLRPIEEVMLDIADVFNRSADGAGKNEASVKLYGKAWEDMLPFMNQGRESIASMMKASGELGTQMSTQDAQAADAFNTQIKLLDAQAKGFSITIGKHMLGPLTELMSVMNDLGSGPIGDAAKFFFRGLNEQMVLFGTLIKEIGASIEFAFGKLTFDQLKTKMRLFEAQASAKLLLLENPEAAKYLDGPVKDGRSVEMGVSKPQIPTGGGKTTNEAAKEQERLGQALLDIYRSQNNALEIRNKLQGGQGQLSEFFLAFDRQQQFRREDEAEQERMGRLIVANTQREVQATEEKQAREREGLVKNLQAWIEYDNAVGASTELRYQHQVDLLKANLAQQVDITTDEAGRLLDAWKNVDNVAADSILQNTRLTVQQRETIELQSLTKLQQIHEQTSQNVFEGWSRGLQRYVQDTQSGFGLGADLARRTAQAMEQNFRTFFFDAFEGKIRSLKDVFQSFGNFAKQILSQVLAQLATMLVLKGLTGGFGGFSFGSMFGGSSAPSIGGADAGGLMGLKFASGGPVLGAGNQDSVRAMLMPGEGVLNRKGMQALAQLNSGALNSGTAAPSAAPNVVINFHGMPAGERPQVNYRRRFEELVVDIVLRNQDLQTALRIGR